MLYNTGMSFDGKKIQAWLTQQGRSQGWLAENLGVSVVTVNRWINGHGEPSPLKKELLKKVLTEPVETIPPAPPVPENVQFDRERVKNWLELNKRNQSWLAERLGVYPGTVNRWLHGRLEPSQPKVALIERLMYEGGEQAPELKGGELTEDLKIELTTEIWTLVKKLAELQGVTPEEYVKNCAARLAEELANLILKSKKI